MGLNKCLSKEHLHLEQNRLPAFDSDASKLPAIQDFKMTTPLQTVIYI